jgi:hypothetical protein
MTESDIESKRAESIVIDKSNFKSPKTYHSMYEDFYLTKWLERRQKVTINKEIMSDATYEKRRCRAILRDCTRKAKWRKLLAIDYSLGGMSSGNLPPLLLKELIAPMFFKNFPHGNIRYVPVWKLRGIQLMKIGAELGAKYQPEFEGLMVPHAGSNLDMELSLRGSGVDVALHFTFPCLMGINAPLAFGNFAFLTGDPILALDRNTFAAQDVLSRGLSSVYTDSYTPSHGVKRPILIDSLGKAVFSRSDYFSYFGWYATALPRLFDFVEGQDDKGNVFLASMSVSRIISETYLTILSDIPLIRLILAFSILDKFANLACALGLSKLNEPDTWTNLLSPDFLARCSTILEHVPGLGHHFSLLSQYTEEQLAGITHERSLEKLHLRLSPSKLMRIYRNSHHGYMLRDDSDRKILLSHSGDIFNEFPDIVFLFWNAFLVDPLGFLRI